MRDVKYLLPLLLFVSPVFGQDHERGKLSDGRPYRIDKEGMQLSDYIAELEVANDDLKRQVIALEDELDAKAKTGGAKPAAPVREHDLTPSRTLPAAQKSDTTACDTKIRELTDRITSLEQSQRPQQIPICDYESPHNPYFTEVKTLREQLSRGPKAEAYDEEKAKRIDLEDSVAKLESDLEAARNQIKAKDAELSGSKESISRLEKERDEAHISAAAKVESERREESARASLKTEPVSEPKQEAKAEIKIEKQPAPPPEPKVEQKRDQGERTPEPVSPEDLAAARSEFNEQLGKVQSLVTQRKNLYDSMKSHGKGVSINLRPLISENGKSLDTYRSEASKLKADSDLPGIRSGLAQIMLILNEDIDLLRRLTK